MSKLWGVAVVVYRVLLSSCLMGARLGTLLRCEEGAVFVIYPSLFNSRTAWLISAYSDEVKGTHRTELGWLGGGTDWVIGLLWRLVRIHESFAWWLSPHFGTGIRAVLDRDGYLFVSVSLCNQKHPKISLFLWFTSAKLKSFKVFWMLQTVVQDSTLEWDLSPFWTVITYYRVQEDRAKFVPT